MISKMEDKGNENPRALYVFVQEVLINIQTMQIHNRYSPTCVLSLVFTLGIMYKHEPMM